MSTESQDAACGHDPAQFVTADEGTSYCPACEAEARDAAQSSAKIGVSRFNEERADGNYRRDWPR